MACGRLCMLMDEYDGHWQSMKVTSGHRQSMKAHDGVWQTLNVHEKV